MAELTVSKREVARVVKTVNQSAEQQAVQRVVYLG
jgi:hypothetical protein